VAAHSVGNASSTELLLLQQQQQQQQHNLKLNRNVKITIESSFPFPSQTIADQAHIH
jgi:hypothetical protein